MGRLTRIKLIYGFKRNDIELTVNSFRVKVGLFAQCKMLFSFVLSQFLALWVPPLA